MGAAPPGSDLHKLTRLGRDWAPSNAAGWPTTLAGGRRPMISAIVCTYNRAEKLANCLNALSKANPPTRGGWELLVIDNNSTDDTKTVVDGFARSTALDVRYFFEGEQGLAMARNRGLAE